MTGPQPTEDRLLMDLIKTNRSTEGETMTMKQYRKHGKYNPRQAATKFGSWNEARASAGIYKKHSRQQVTDQEILEDIKRLNNELDREVKTKDYNEKGEYALGLVYNRFDSFVTARHKAYNI